MRSKRWGGHQYFPTKNSFYCLEQVCVAPPLLGHLYGCCWYPILDTLGYSELMLSLMKGFGLKHSSVMTPDLRLHPFPCPELLWGSGALSCSTLRTTPHQPPFLRKDKIPFSLCVSNSLHLGFRLHSSSVQSFFRNSVPFYLLIISTIGYVVR